jgi:16S rRNA (uracil1498-N3)-methyltransferase
MIDRFFIDDSFSLSSVALKGSEFHHLAHVMRIREGDRIELINGRGMLAQGLVEKLDKEQAQISITQSEKHDPCKYSISIAIPLLKMDRLEWAIEKATELGATTFRLFPADHSEKKELSEHQLERLEHIIISATKQCGRLFLPALNEYRSLADAIQSDDLLLFGDLDPHAPTVHVQTKNILFISGPEKGFSPKEISLLKQRGTGVRLHNNVLRAETAPLVALSQLYPTVNS